LKGDIGVAKRGRLPQDFEMLLLSSFSSAPDRGACCCYPAQCGVLDQEVSGR